MNGNTTSDRWIRANEGGLVGFSSSRANTIHSYWDTSTSGTDLSAAGRGEVTANLQRPRRYDGIYATWDDDGTDYWDFGTSRQYPALKVDFNGDDASTWEEFGFQIRNDLIAIANLEQLDAIRWDRNGDGVPDTGTSPANQAAYAAAFPSLDPASHCAGGDGCKGYELVTNLNFDDASSYAGGKVNDKWSDPHESGAGWTPIPEFFAEFQGNGKTISNLYINSSGRGEVGLFGNLSEAGTITHLRLADVDVTSSGDSPGFDAPGTGGVVGSNSGKIQYSSVTGHVTREGSSSSANNDAVGEVGVLHIVGGLVGENKGHIIASYAAVAVRGKDSHVGGLAGQNAGGTITSSYATGKVSVDGDLGSAGGLVGNNISGTIISSYASGDVIGSDDHPRIGGLVGFPTGGGEINASYSTSVVSGNRGGLTGNSGTARLLSSYWDTETSSVSNGERGKTTAELQGPTNETADTGIYSTWDKGIWDFGTARQYPALKVGDFDGDGTDNGWREFGHQVRERPDLTLVFEQGGTVAQLAWTSVRTDHWTTPPRRIEYALYRREGDSPWSPRGNPPTATEHTDGSLNPESKYSYQVRVLVNGFMARGSNIIKQSGAYVMDADGDGLIEVSNLAQLDAIRFDPDGDGTASPGNASAYARAFKVTEDVLCSVACRGYELTADLDFDENDDGEITGADAAYWNEGAGWKPVDYDAVFEGNGYSISNLYIRSSTGARYVGLFGKLGSSGLINHVRLVDVDVAASGDFSVGGLVGLNDGGTIVASRVIGQIAATGAESVAGGLVGQNAGGIIAGSYAASSVLGSADARGGLVGKNDGGTIIAAYATGSEDGGGGLVGANAGGTIIAAYSTGAANGGLVGTNSLSVTHGISSYWDTSTSRAVSSAGGRGKTTAELQGPTGYTGIYANWNVDIDDADKDGDPFTGGDNPWNFGSSEDYPTLNLSALGELSFVDRAALAEFYHATAGENWTRNDNWLSDKPMETWWGVKVNVAGRVTRVIMPENNLVGRLPASLGDLAKLEQLVLGGNSLSGPLPPELGSLANLVLLDLKNNSEASNFKEGPPSGLNGPIPAELGNLDDLAELYLNGNKFSGAVSTELGNLGSLFNLMLHNNPDLTGQLPSSFTNLTRLIHLNFHTTGLCAPSSLRQWSSGLESFTGPYCE